MLEDYGKYSRKAQNKTSIGIPTIFGIAFLVTLGICVPGLVNKHTQHMQIQLRQSIPTWSQIQEAIFLKIKPHHVLFQQINTSSMVKNNLPYHIETPCTSQKNTVDALHKRLESVRIPHSIKSYFNDSQQCNTVFLGPFTHYSEAQQYHLKLQSLHIDHQIQSER